MSQFFQLFSYCIPVKGYKKAVICDLERNIIQPIPLIVYELLENNNQRDISMEFVLGTYSNEEKQLIKEYVTFLFHNQFGYVSNKPLTSIPLHVDQSIKPVSKINAIVDFDQNSTHSFSDIMKQLNDLGCLALQLRYFYQITFEKIHKELSATHLNHLQNLEIMIWFSDEFRLEKVLELKESFPMLKKIILSNSSENTVYHREDILIIYTTEQLVDETCCGVTNQYYCQAETQLFIESIHFNSCLNKKISIDKEGNIKNCPSMRNRYGSIFTTKLNDIFYKESFQEVWKITKDHIDVCSDCELRYVCQDCRAYIENEDDIFSKPVKCNYNPYEL